MSDCSLFVLVYGMVTEHCWEHIIKLVELNSFKVFQVMDFKGSDLAGPIIAQAR